jgi:glycosyltransferase involved in cell wall biosynthesis
MKPLVSVVVPSYNHAAFATECAESVMSQTFRDWEMVVVDDASTDNSAEVWRSFTDPRIRVEVNEKNIGTYATQNRGVSLAKGDFIAILDSDDFWAPQKLERQVEALVKNRDAPFCYCLGWRTDSSGMPDTKNDNHGDWPRKERQRLLPYLLEQNRLLASGTVFRKNNASFDESLRFSGDWVALIHASNGSDCVCVSDRLTFWRIHGQSSHKIRKDVTLEEIRVRRAILNGGKAWVDCEGDAPLILAKLGGCAYHLAALYVLWKMPSEARTAALFALRHYPDRRAALRRAAACFLPLLAARRRLWPLVEDGFLPREVRNQAPLEWQREKLEKAKKSPGPP